MPMPAILTPSHPRMTPQSQPSATPTLGISLAVFLVGFFAFLQVYAIQAILPTLIIALNTNEVAIGLAVGMTVMAIAIVSPFMGMLSDAIGRKGLIVGAVAFLAIPTVGAAMSQSVGELNLWRFLQGLCVPGMTVVLLAYISEEFPHAIARMMSLYVAGTVLGGFSGRFLLGHFHEWLDWRHGLGLMAVMTLVGAVIIAEYLPNSRHFIKNANIKAALTTLIAHSKNRHVQTTMALGGCVLFSLVGCFTFINLHLSHAPYKLNASQLANLFSIYLVGVIITPLSSRLIARFGLVLILRLAIISSMFGLIITLSTPLWAIVIGLTLMSSGVFVTQTATISHLSAHIHQGRSLASGLYYLGYYAGGSIGAWACGLAWTHHTWHGVVGLILSLQVLGLLIACVLIKK